MEHGIRLRPRRGLKRAANDILRSAAVDGDGALPYFCECEDVDCLRAVWLEPLAYDRIRRSGRPIRAEHDVLARAI